jgi:uncharacterized ion transporter superfamily protein YfcC
MSKPRFPHPLALMVGCIIIAAALTWILPAGKYERREDTETGRNVVVPGTYARVEARPVGPFGAIVAIPKGIVDAASVIALILLIGGGFTVVERTGTFLRLVNGLVRRLRGRGLMVIPVAGVAFALGGIMMQMQEELIAFVPVLLLLTRQLGFTAVTAVAMSLGTAAVGAAFSPVNPFQVIIAQNVAELPPASGSGFRMAFLLPAVGLWMAATMYHARRTRVPPESSATEETPRSTGVTAPCCSPSWPRSPSISTVPSAWAGNSTSSGRCFSRWACWRDCWEVWESAGRLRHSWTASGPWPSRHWW